MAQKIDKVYQDAVEAKLLPGLSAIAGDKNGKILYTNSFGLASLKPSRTEPFTTQTICSLASMSKLITAIAVLQCVEQGKFTLDEDMRPLLPRMGQHGIITGFDDDNNGGSPIIQPFAKPITLRHLLSHTSGHEYDWLNPLLQRWRVSRGEQPFSGPTVADKSSLPLLFEPGTAFAYGGGSDWAGKAVEVATGKTLDAWVREHIAAPLGAEVERGLGFWPLKRPEMKDRVADMAVLTVEQEGVTAFDVANLKGVGVPPAVDAPWFDAVFGAEECLGGGGLYGSAEAYFAVLSAVFRRDERLLSKASYEELFRPQLDEAVEQKFNEYLALTSGHAQYLGMGLPAEVRKTWSFAGMVCKDGLEGRFEKGTIFWGGVPSEMWFMDREAGTCGVVTCQIIPPMHPDVMALHGEFQKGVLQMVKGC